MRLLSAIIAVALAWVAPVKPTLDFDEDARYAQQIIDGLNPYDFGVVPRPPSAWLLQMPLAWVNTELFSRLAGACAVFAVGWLAWRITRLAPMWLPVITAIVGLTAGAKMMVESGNMSSVIAVLFVVTWWWRSGIAVGVAAALRLYPMVLVFAVKRWSALWTVGFLTVAGLLLVPDLGVSDLTDNAAMFTEHGGSGSAVRFIGLPLTLALGAVLAWRATRVGFDQAMGLTACAAVLVPSISWPGYHLILAPVVAWAAVHGRWWTLAAVPLWFTGFGVFGLGTAHFVAAVIVLSGVWTRESPPLPKERGAPRFLARNRAQLVTRSDAIRRER